MDKEYLREQFEKHRNIIIENNTNNYKKLWAYLEFLEDNIINTKVILNKIQNKIKE